MAYYDDTYFFNSAASTAGGLHSHPVVDQQPAGVEVDDLFFPSLDDRQGMAPMPDPMATFYTNPQPAIGLRKYHYSFFLHQCPTRNSPEQVAQATFHTMWLNGYSQPQWTNGYFPGFYPMSQPQHMGFSDPNALFSGGTIAFNTSAPALGPNNGKKL